MMNFICYVIVNPYLKAKKKNNKVSDVKNRKTHNIFFLCIKMYKSTRNDREQNERE